MRLVSNIKVRDEAENALLLLGPNLLLGQLALRNGIYHDGGRDRQCDGGRFVVLACLKLS